MNSTALPAGKIKSISITDAQWSQYEDLGYLNLGKLVNAAGLGELQRRIDDIMQGKASADYGRMLMQLDGDTGKYEDAGEQTKGFKGATPNYRKIQDLEFDPLFLSYMQEPMYREICARVYGKEAEISASRAMFFNKPAHKGTWLPWHQDRWSALSLDPLLTVWTALDPATEANGCVQVIPGSHKLGIINPDHHSGFLTKEMAEQHCKPEKAIKLELKAGEVSLLHNWLLHASDVNRSDTSRRAFSVCYMDARTRDTKTGITYSKIFGKEALTPESVRR
ncbi:MAG: phytanoyl-CoA dioxygenase family protein [Lacunisphaera sp.]|nr:phytanoyl-CoA dioxygenase family protein [Lacunisphaera sp.]